MSSSAGVDVVLRDGSTVCLRAIGAADDVDAVLDFLNHLSLPASTSDFSAIPSLSPRGSGRWYAHAGGRRRADRGNGPAGSSASPATIAILPRRPRAEVAFAIADAVQGHGIGTRLLEQLARLARTAGIDPFDAYVLADNRRMLDVFRDSGFAMTTTNDHGVACHVVLSLDVTPQFEEKAGGAIPDRRRRIDEGVLRAARRRGRRREPGARADRIRDPPQPARGGLHRHGRAGASDAPRDRRPDGVPARRRHSRRRWTSPSSSCRPRTCSRSVDDCIAKGVRAICVDQRRLRRVRRGRTGAGGGAGRAGPRGRRAG